MRCGSSLMLMLAALVVGMVNTWGHSAQAQKKEAVGGDPIVYEAFVWPNERPQDCPFEQSKELVGVKLKGRASQYRVADTWYPTWSSNGNLYSPYTDGRVGDDLCISDSSWKDQGKDNARTGQAVMLGEDPLTLTINSLGMVKGHPGRYDGRYPCGSLIHNNIWYYGTYLAGPFSKTEHEGFTYNWPVVGPVVGYRVSKDYGKTWTETPHTADKPLFPEPKEYLGPVKIGGPHFVDFGKNMRHSPDGKAYLVAHGSTRTSPPARFAHNSWISADQVYLIRVQPSPDTINDLSSYEFFAGYDASGQAIWSREFDDLQPLLEWQDNMGCVTITYNPPLKKYLMCVTDGWPTCYKMSSYILEADQITGPWRIVTYLKDFGEQAYFLNFPSKFISESGLTLWLCYSGNFAPAWNNRKIEVNPPGSAYGLVLQEVQLLRSTNQQ